MSLPILVPGAPTIMVVDDDVDGRFLVEHHLRRSLKDCAVVACPSANDALLLLEARPVDAIVTDHHLGKSSGADFIRQARHRGIMCPIVMVTGSDDPQVEREAYEAGATKVFLGRRGDFADFLLRLFETRHLAHGAEKNRP